MEQLTLKPKAIYSISNVKFFNKYFAFDIPTLVENVKQIHSWKGGNLNAIILLKNTDKSAVLTALQEGTEINSYQSNEAINLQIIEGRIKFYANSDSVTLKKGQLLTLHEKTRYKIKSLEESVFILTVMNRINASVND
jgi:quercetin dioxygenase-like cupin family protein